MRKAWAALAVGVLGVSSSSILIKLVPGIPPVAIAAYRLGLSTLLLGFAALASRPGDFRAFTPRDLALAAVGGAFLAGHFVSWISSLQYTSVASSVVLVTLQPIFVLLGSWLWFAEGTSGRGLAGVAVALAGGGLIGAADLGGGGDELRGDLLALVGAALVAGYILVGRALRPRIAILPYTTVVYGACTLVLIAWAAGAGVPLHPYSRRELVIFLAMAVLPTILGHTMFNYAIGYLPAPVVSMSTLGEPIGASILAWLWLDEAVSPFQLAGGGAVLAGLALFLRSPVARRGDEARGAPVRMRTAAHDAATARKSMGGTR